MYAVDMPADPDGVPYDLSPSHIHLLRMAMGNAEFQLIVKHGVRHTAHGDQHLLRAIKKINGMFLDAPAVPVSVLEAAVAATAATSTRFPTAPGRVAAARRLFPRSFVQK